MACHSSPKGNENHESWESLFRRTLSKERLFTSTRLAENPFHWIQLLDPFDQHDTRKVCKSAASHSDSAGNENVSRSGHLSAHKSLQSKLPEAVAALAQAACKVSGESCFGGSNDAPGWPLIPFSKVQTIKCEKCCLEFCSPINHRRHLRTLHRRTSHAEKEDPQSQRQQLAIFWDKLSPEEAYKIAAVKNLQMEGLSGDKVVRALGHLLQQPSLFALPHSYVKSGAMLLELVQSRLSRIFLTSSELFKILDGSSEKTFPSFGLSAMQKYVFEGEAGKVGLESKNLVASLSFLIEQNLVKAFIKNKDEEAWRCQTALVEEEEASQRKQAQLQARKDMKKVRQKHKELKASAVAACRLLDIDSSDDETSFSCLSAGSQRRPSTNAFENLNHQLAEEAPEFDNSVDVVTIAGSSPPGKSLMPVESNYEEVSTALCSPCEKNLVIEDLKDEVLLGALSSSCEKGLHYGDLNDVSGVVDDVDSNDVAGMADDVDWNDVDRTADDVGGWSKPLGVKAKDPPNLPGTDTGSLLDASDVQRPYNFRKHKHHAERSFYVRGDVSPFPYQKQLWKERRNISARNDFKLNSANEIEEDMGSANKVVGIRPKQYVGKPLGLKNYQGGSKGGASVWTKKIGKCDDTPSAKVPDHTEFAKVPDHTEFANDTQLEACDAGHVLNADWSIGVLSAAGAHDHELGSLFMTSTTMCSNVEPSLCAISSEEQSTTKTGSCYHEGSQEALIVADSGQCYQENALVAPVVIGSVVIGSFDVPLESVAGQMESALTASSWKESAEVSNTVDGSKKELDEPSGQVERLRELSEVPKDNGQCESHRDRKGDGNSSIVLFQSGAETKENKEHSVCQAGMGKSSVVQGIPVLKTKVWRPLVSNINWDCCKDEISTLDADNPNDVDKVSSKHSLAIKGDINKNALKEHESDQTIQENSHLFDLSTSAQAKTVVVGGTARKAHHTSTIEDLASFLSKRWFDALSSSDSVIFSPEAEEGGARQLGATIVDLQRRDSNMDSKDNPAPHLNKGAINPLANATRAYGPWKQGCSGSAIAVNRRMMGKENSHFASRYASYRYVPK